MVEGLEHSLTISGDPLDLIVMRKGSSTETTGGFETAKADELLNLPGIARDEQGHPLGRQGTAQHPDRRAQNGTQDQHHHPRRPAGLAQASARFQDRRRQWTSSRARASASSARKCRRASREPRSAASSTSATRKSIGSSASSRPAAAPAESEVWADLKDVEKNTGRDGSVSCVQLRAASSADYDQLQKTIDDDARFKLAAIPEPVYFETQSRSGVFLKGAGTMIAVLLTFGAMFSAANTMFAAVSARTREIGTMRALGFSQFDVLISFLGESLILCALWAARSACWRRFP